MMHRHLIASLFVFISLFSSAAVIDSIHFEGLTRTKESYLRSIIACKEGMDVSLSEIEEDVDLLKNLNLFFDVNSNTETNENGITVTFTIVEAKYLYPSVWASGFRDQLKLVLGVNHINFLGKAQEIGASYQYYDRHSFYVFWKANRHRNRLTGHEVSLEKYSTIEPLYFLDTVSQFNFDNYSASLGGHFWITRYLKAGIGGKYMYESYEQRDDAYPLAGKRFNFNKYQVRTALRFNNIAWSYERQDGIDAEVYGEYIHTEGYPQASFLKGTIRAMYFKNIKKHGNFAIRGQFGVATNNASPFSPFVLDGILNVRGIGNRVERGTAELVLNTEYRCTFYRHRIFSFQSVLFADYGALREPGKGFDSMFNNETNLFVGGGLRFHLNVWYKTCLRVDYSFNPTNTGVHGITFGIGQFF